MPVPTLEQSNQLLDKKEFGIADLVKEVHMAIGEKEGICAGMVLLIVASSLSKELADLVSGCQGPAEHKCLVLSEDEHMVSSSTGFPVLVNKVEADRIELVTPLGKCDKVLHNDNSSLRLLHRPVGVVGRPLCAERCREVVAISSPSPGFEGQVFEQEGYDEVYSAVPEGIKHLLRTSIDWSNAMPSLVRRWLWLPLASFFFAFSCSRWPVPGAYPAALACCLRFSRANRPRHLVVLVVSAFVGLLCSLWGISGKEGLPAQLGVAAVVTLVVMAPVAADRALMELGLSDDVHVATFGLLVAVCSHFTTLVSPFGVIAIPGTEFLWRNSLAQLLSVTGVFGAYFFNGWTAAVLSGVLLGRLGALPGPWTGSLSSRKHLAVWGLFLFCLYFSTGLTAVLAPTNGDGAPAYVRVGGVVMSGPEDYATERWLEAIYAATDAAASAGARVVVWSEWSVRVDTYAGDALDAAACDSGLCRLLARVRAVAARHGAYVLPCFIADEYALPGGQRAGNRLVRSRNVEFLVGPDGRTVFQYTKAHLVLGWEDQQEPGEENLPVADTPYGRIGAVICMDLAFPQYIAQAGRKRADLLLAPSADWPAIYKWATYTFALRAAESGATLVRVDTHGRSIVADPYGNVLFEDSCAAQLPHYFEHAGTETECGLFENKTCEKDPYFWVKDVPTRSRRATLYPWLLDVHAYVGYIAVALLVVFACATHRIPESRRVPLVASLLRDDEGPRREPLID
eukprot:m51a1_g1858 hypothetical protein (739) ;mRNA; r:613563-620156